MFSVVFEVCPKREKWEAYLGTAKMLRPELEQVEGFVDNIRYKSLARDGWILSLSSWRDEKSVVRWRTTMRHHEAQENGRSEILQDYHLRVGQITHDTHVPPGHVLQDHRHDETETGEGTTMTLTTVKWPNSLDAKASPVDIAQHLGLDQSSSGLISWDVYEAVLTPGELILMKVWKTKDHALHSTTRCRSSDDFRSRQIRVIRDYGMFDRREAPQYYPSVLR